MKSLYISIFSAFLASQAAFAGQCTINTGAMFTGDIAPALNEITNSYVVDLGSNGTGSFQESFAGDSSHPGINTGSQASALQVALGGGKDAGLVSISVSSSQITLSNNGITSSVPRNAINELDAYTLVFAQDSYGLTVGYQAKLVVTAYCN